MREHLPPGAPLFAPPAPPNAGGSWGRPGGAEADERPRLDLLVFVLGGERYGLRIEQVDGVEERRAITQLPGAPAGVLGVFNRQGDVLAALDPAQLLLGQPGPSEGSYLVVGRSSHGPVGLLVDYVEAMLALDPETVEPPLPTLDAGRVRFVRGQAQVEDRWLTVLDLDGMVGAIAARPQAGRG